MKPSDLSEVIEQLKGVQMDYGDDLSNHWVLTKVQDITDNDIVLGIVANMLTKMSEAQQEAVETLQQVLSEIEQDIPEPTEELTTESLERVAALADELDSSEDLNLQKYASVLDQILLTIGAPPGAKTAFKQAEDKEVERLRNKYREQAVEDYYKAPSEKLDEKIKAADTIKTIKDSIKQYRPLEAPLSTRTCPEHPGSPLQRIGDCVYQCSLDKKVYDFKSGYTSLKGNKVPGGDVSQQTQSLGDRAPDHMSFDTREGRLNS